MKRVLVGLVAILSLASFVHAQKLNLVGTRWVLKYTTGRANSKDYQEYARMIFEKSGKLVFDNGETGRWTLKGNKLTVQNDKESSTGLVNYLEARISATTGTGTAELGMTTTAPYWIRLIKEK